MTLKGFPILFFLTCILLVPDSVAAQSSATDPVNGQTTQSKAPVVYGCWPGIRYRSS